MAATIHKYYTKLLETLVDYNDNHDAPFSNEKLRQEISIVMTETEEEEHNVILNAITVTMDNFCHSPIMTNTQRKITNVTNERRISSNILAEAIK